MATAASSTHETLNDRLRRRREELGASIGQVAGWASLDAERLSRIEAGSPIRSWEFDAICRALAVDSGALARGFDRTPRRSVARFKAASWVDPTPDDFRTLSLAAELGRIGGFLAQEVERPSRLAELRSPEPVGDRREPWKQGYLLGENARRALAPRPEPIRDLEELLTGWGVHIARVAFSSRDLDAASLWERGSLPVILLNSHSQRSQSSLSRRALLAHELCHLLHDSGEKNKDLTTQLSWSEDTGNYQDAIEKRARAFAPAFLAPRDEVRHWFNAGTGKGLRDPERMVEELARRWGFSFRGAIWHAKNCRLIKSAAAKELDRSTPDRDHEWSDEFEQAMHEPRATAGVGPDEEIAPMAEGFLASLVHEAVRRGIVSAGRGREIVTWK